MDYSASINDADNPAGASPWGSSPTSSPQPPRTSTFPSRDIVSPTPYNPDQSGGAGYPQEDMIGAGGFNRPDSSAGVSVSDVESRRPDTAGSTQSDAEAHQGTGQQYQQQTAQQQQYPAGQHRSEPHRYHHSSARQGHHASAPHYKLQAKITGLERTGRKDPILRFDVHTNLPKFRTTQFRDVRRTHSEFIKLADHLISSNPEAIVPAVPPALTSAGAGTDEDEARVKASLQRWLNYVCSNDVLMRDDEMVLFVESLGLAESDFGVKLGAMNIQEPHQGLANAYRKLGKTIQSTGDFHAAQGTAEATTIGDPLQYHSQDAFIVKETLTNRHILLRELIQAQQLTRSKLNAADRLKASSSVRREKVDEAISALDEARSNEVYLHNKTQRVTANLLLEKQRWFARTATDLRLSIREYVIREIEAERRTLATLESIRPDIRAIDASGGLSRLGRESHPAARRASLAASQGPKGDSWSGVPRRPDGLNRSISGSFMSTPEGANGEEEGVGRERSLSGSTGGLPGLKEEDDEDRVDARNAASRLANVL
ncbi:hypothetical protein SS1G_09417 [Sclerotinia sclerotiorum 1980 UF-70]|uniref:Vacuolar protein sorting-associated protein 17 n=1 Tax=Sclerotinia sclerotiorum (strain ATCC 18683 / 1980 / Ss-1) TaxID=665079 RepID=A7EVQ8_SCLS1|nr:hypothetical protein SS1G_09417 [Sclerotinia sclerotiorum 1980 UF-70]EDN93550.1 hypothetical protein SS1G_09417 [Sclerotinia sclerotiorum 1980 UF-70]